MSSPFACAARYHVARRRDEHDRHEGEDQRLGADGGARRACPASDATAGRRDERQRDAPADVTAHRERARPDAGGDRDDDERGGRRPGRPPRRGCTRAPAARGSRRRRRSRPTTRPMAIPKRDRERRPRPPTRRCATRGPVAPLAPALAGIDERRVGLLQRVGEALVDARAAEALVLPQRDDEQLARGAVVAADEDDAAVDEVAHVDRAARRGLARRPAAASG